MGFVGRIFALVMIPLAILVILEELNMFTLSLFFDKVFIVSVLIIALQIYSIISLVGAGGGLRFINILLFLIFIAPAVAYILRGLVGTWEPLALIIGIITLVEALYALH